MKRLLHIVSIGSLVFIANLATIARAQTPPKPTPADEAVRRQVAPFEKILPAAEVQAMTKALAKGHLAPGIDIVHHILKVDVLQIQPGKKGGALPTECQEPEDVGATAHVLETLDFEGRMALERTIPTLDKQNRALTNFRVLTWQATSFSQKMQVDILYILSQDKQEMGEIRAAQEATGFPADFTFDLTFDARANNKTVVMRHHGMPKGHNFTSIPPTLTSPAISQFEACYVQMNHPQFGLIRFVPKECNDKSGVTASPIPPERAEKTIDLGAIRKDITIKKKKPR